MNKINKSLDGQKIGFSIDDTQGLILTVPKFIKNLPSDNRNIVKEIFLYYKIFKKHKKDNMNQKSIKEKDYFRNLEEGNTEGDKYAFEIIELYLSLLNDYIEKGLLLFRRREVNLNKKGNINWKQTIQLNRELITNDSIIYGKVYHNNLKIDYNHPITLIQAFTLMKLEKLLSVKLKLSYDYRYLKQFENSSNYIKGNLQKYKREMFSDREKKIFKILESIYLDKYKSMNFFKSKEKLSYVENFDLIWEKMLKVALADEYNQIKEIMPKGYYSITDSENKENHTFRGLRAIPDILISEKYNNNDYLFVLDAKNYVPNFEVGMGMPQSSDIIKQIFYKQFMSKEFNKNSKYDNRNIINAFLLPAELDSQNKIKYIGLHTLNTGMGSSHIDSILCFYIDFNSLRKIYLKADNNYRNEILDYIYETYKNLVR